ncbi:hypothetical protein D3C77_520770 [compost metagenome]
MRALQHASYRKHSAQSKREQQGGTGQAWAAVTQGEEQRKQGETGGCMAARPATTWFIGGRARAEQFAVGFLATELLQAPGALHGGNRFDRGDETGRQAHGQDQIAQLPTPAFEALPEETADEGHNGSYAEGDHHLFGAVMQDVFEEVAMPTDELAGNRVERQLGQVHVQ